MYVFDTSPLSTLFRNYYPSRFPTLWNLFDDLVTAGKIVSTREVLREIEVGPIENLRSWASSNHHVFAIPNASEGAFVQRIFSVAHFQKNIEQQKLLKGGYIADPFVIAKAAVETKAVVTIEVLKPNSAKIPNICQHFGVRCLALEDFMEAENWTF